MSLSEQMVASTKKTSTGEYYCPDIPRPGEIKRNPHWFVRPGRLCQMRFILLLQWFTCFVFPLQFQDLEWAARILTNEIDIPCNHIRQGDEIIQCYKCILALAATMGLGQPSAEYPLNQLHIKLKPIHIHEQYTCKLCPKILQRAILYSYIRYLLDDTCINHEVTPCANRRLIMKFFTNTHAEFFKEGARVNIPSWTSQINSVSLLSGAMLNLNCCPPTETNDKRIRPLFPTFENTEAWHTDTSNHFSKAFLARHSTTGWINNLPTWLKVLFPVADYWQERQFLHETESVLSRARLYGRELAQEVHGRINEALQEYKLADIPQRVEMVPREPPPIKQENKSVTQNSQGVTWAARVKTADVDPVDNSNFPTLGDYTSQRSLMQLSVQSVFK